MRCAAEKLAAVFVLSAIEKLHCMDSQRFQIFFDFVKMDACTKDTYYPRARKFSKYLYDKSQVPF